MLYDHTAGRFVSLRFVAFICVAVCAGSASVGWHKGQTIGRFVDGFLAVDFARLAAWNFTAALSRLETVTPGAYAAQRMRGCSDEPV